jgi:hypothetical protein
LTESRCCCYGCNRTGFFADTSPNGAYREIEIKVKLAEESYTSKASLLDLDEIPVYDPKCTEKLQGVLDRCRFGRDAANVGDGVEASGL